MNHSKGNQKHLTLSQRIEIEKGLNYNCSFAEIARTLEKDPSTISKEVRKYRAAKTRNNDFASIPCASRINCSAHYLCSKECRIMCKICREPNKRCSEICDNYKPIQYSKLSKPPYVCNGCGKRTNCLLEKKVYVAKYSDDFYREILVSSREGINQTAESIKVLDDLVSPLIKKGQSIAHSLCSSRRGNSLFKKNFVYLYSINLYFLHVTLT